MIHLVGVSASGARAQERAGAEVEVWRVDPNPIPNLIPNTIPVSILNTVPIPNPVPIFIPISYPIPNPVPNPVPNPIPNPNNSCIPVRRRAQKASVPEFDSCPRQ